VTAHNNHNRFTGTHRDIRALRVEWSLESETALHEGRARLLLDALKRARRRGEIGEGDCQEWQSKLKRR
jgi:hypothetical protein